MSIKFSLSIFAGKFAQKSLKLLHKGTATPGKIAQRIDKDAISHFKLPKKIIYVTGTNGKTTTANLIAHCLRKSGFSVAHNSAGSNMAGGVLSCFLENSDLFGNVKTDVLVLEIDERSSKYIFPYLPAGVLVCTNLFRDSIMRNGHPEFIFSKINDYINDDTTLVLNANDAISSRLGNNEAKKVYFGVEENSLSTKTHQNKTHDSLSCPNCHNVLQYDFYHYNHIGSFSCACGYKMPNASFTATDIEFENNTFNILHNDEKIELKAKNIFDLTNKTCAAAALVTAGFNLDIIKHSATFKELANRQKDEMINQTLVTSILSKNQNPISVSTSLMKINENDDECDVLLLITDSKDKIHGLEDTSWVYDADFHLLSKDSIKNVIVAGSRCYDLALCLTLNDVDKEKIKVYENYEDLETNIAKNIDTKHLYILFELYATDVVDLVKKALF